MAQAVERILGKDEVGGSIPPSSSRKHFQKEVFFFFIDKNQAMIYSVFYKAFKKYTGKTPTQYIENSRVSG